MKHSSLKFSHSPGIQLVPASGTCAIAAASSVRLSGSVRFRHAFCKRGVFFEGSMDRADHTSPEDRPQLSAPGQKSHRKRSAGFTQNHGSEPASISFGTPSEPTIKIHSNLGTASRQDPIKNSQSCRVQKPRICYHARESGDLLRLQEISAFMEMTTGYREPGPSERFHFFDDRFDRNAEMLVEVARRGRCAKARHADKGICIAGIF